MPKLRFLPYILILGAGVIWGSTFSLTLIATSGGGHPLALAAWQVIISSIFLALLCLVTGTTAFNPKNIGCYTVLAVIGISIPNVLYYNAAPHLSAGILSITISTVPLFTYGIMLLLRFESLVIRRAFGIVLGMVAILLLVLPDHGLESSDASFWILAVMLCAILYSVENVYISKGVSDQIDVRELLTGSNIIAIFILVPVTLWMDVGEPVSWLFSTPGWAITGVGITSALAYMMFFYTIKISGPVFASQCGYIITISGVLWGILIFSEQHSLWIWSSVVVLMVGLALVSPEDGADRDVETHNETAEIEASKTR